MLSASWMVPSDMLPFHEFVDTMHHLFRCYETNKVLVGTDLYEVTLHSYLV